jgi:hypothetical protein
MKDPVQVEARLGQGCDRRHLAPVMVLPRGQGPEGWTLSWVWLLAEDQGMSRSRTSRKVCCRRSTYRRGNGNRHGGPTGALCVLGMSAETQIFRENPIPDR